MSFTQIGDERLQNNQNVQNKFLVVCQMLG